MDETKKLQNRTYLVYSTIGVTRVRAAHAVWDGGNVYLVDETGFTVFSAPVALGYPIVVVEDALDR